MNGLPFSLNGGGKVKTPPKNDCTGEQASGDGWLETGGMDLLCDEAAGIAYTGDAATYNDMWHWLPMWRWAGVNDLWSDWGGSWWTFGIVDMFKTMWTSIINILFLIASLVWAVSRWTVQLAYGSDSLGERLGTQINGWFIKYMNASLTGSTMFFAVATLAVVVFVWALLRGRGRQGLRKLMVGTALPLVLLVAIWTQARAEHKHNEKVDERNAAQYELPEDERKFLPREQTLLLSPRWLYDVTRTGVNAASVPLLDYAQALTDTSTHPVALTTCDAYRAVLEQRYLRARANAEIDDTRLKSLATARAAVPIFVSSLWEKSYLVGYGQAQFGDVTTARRASCLVADWRTKGVSTTETLAVWVSTCDLNKVYKALDENKNPKMPEYGDQELFGCQVLLRKGDHQLAANEQPGTRIAPWHYEDQDARHEAMEQVKLYADALFDPDDAPVSQRGRQTNTAHLLWGACDYLNWQPARYSTDSTELADRQRSINASGPVYPIGQELLPVDADGTKKPPTAQNPDFKESIKIWEAYGSNYTDADAASDLLPGPADEVFLHTTSISDRRITPHTDSYYLAAKWGSVNVDARMVGIKRAADDKLLAPSAAACAMWIMGDFNEHGGKNGDGFKPHQDGPFAPPLYSGSRVPKPEHTDGALWESPYDSGGFSADSNASPGLSNTWVDRSFFIPPKAGRYRPEVVQAAYLSGTDTKKAKVKPVDTAGFKFANGVEASSAVVIPTTATAGTGSHIINSIHGFTRVQSIVFAALSVVVAVMFTMSIVGLAIGAAISELMLAVLIATLPVSLLLAALPLRSTDQLPKMLLKFGIGAAAAHVVFTMVLSLLILVMEFVILAVSAVSTPGDLMHVFLLALAPIIAMKAVRGLGKKVFGVDIGSIGGAVRATSGLAAASMGSGIERYHPRQLVQQGSHAIQRMIPGGAGRALGGAGGSPALAGAAGAGVGGAAGAAAGAALGAASNNVSFDDPPANLANHRSSRGMADATGARTKPRTPTSTAEAGASESGASAGTVSSDGSAEGDGATGTTGAASGASAAAGAAAAGADGAAVPPVPPTRSRAARVKEGAKKAAQRTAQGTTKAAQHTVQGTKKAAQQTAVAGRVAGKATVATGRRVRTRALGYGLVAGMALAPFTALSVGGMAAGYLGLKLARRTGLTDWAFKRVGLPPIGTRPRQKGRVNDLQAARMAAHTSARRMRLVRERMADRRAGVKDGPVVAPTESAEYRMRPPGVWLPGTTRLHAGPGPFPEGPPEPQYVPFETWQPGTGRTLSAIGPGPFPEGPPEPQHVPLGEWEPGPTPSRDGPGTFPEGPPLPRFVPFGEWEPGTPPSHAGTGPEGPPLPRFVPFPPTSTQDGRSQRTPSDEARAPRPAPDEPTSGSG